MICLLNTMEIYNDTFFGRSIYWVFLGVLAIGILTTGIRAELEEEIYLLKEKIRLLMGQESIKRAEGGK